MTTVLAMVMVRLRWLVGDAARWCSVAVVCSVVRNSSNEFFIVRFIILELCPGPLDDLDRFNGMIQLSSTILSFIVLEMRVWTRKVTKKRFFFFKWSMIYHLSFSKIEYGRVLRGWIGTVSGWINLYCTRVGSTQNFIRNRKFKICTSHQIWMVVLGTPL